MEERIVAKIGGTSGSDAEAVARSMEINQDAVGLVVSAPGSLTEAQVAQLPESIDVDEVTACKKVTKLSVSLWKNYREGKEMSSSVRQLITARYANIVNGLGLEGMQGWLREVDPRVTQAVHNGYVDAFKVGEELMDDIYEACGWTVVDPGRATGNLGKNRVAWRDFIESTYSGAGRLVLPGNIDFDGSRLRIFGPGGSDTSGALLAYALGADMYHNMSDSPLYSFDPRVIGHNNAKLVNEITYAEGRDLGRYGTGLLHPDAMTMLMHSGIPTLVRNTFNHEADGTRYSDDLVDSSRSGQVIALSLMDVDLLRITEPGSSENYGQVSQLTSLLGSKAINIAHINDYGSDGLVFVLEHNQTETELIFDAQHAIQEAIGTNGSIEHSHQALLSAVGYDLIKNSHEVHIALGGVAKRHNTEITHRFEGQHTIRVTVDHDKQMDALVDAHDILIGTTIGE